MKLKEYIEKLETLLIQQGNLELIYSSDDEGNNYEYVRYSPTLAYYLEADSSVISDEDLGEWDEEDYNRVICIN